MGLATWIAQLIVPVGLAGLVPGNHKREAEPPSSTRLYFCFWKKCTNIRCASKRLTEESVFSKNLMRTAHDALLADATWANITII